MKVFWYLKKIKNVHKTSYKGEIYGYALCDMQYFLSDKTGCFMYKIFIWRIILSRKLYNLTLGAIFRCRNINTSKNTFQFLISFLLAVNLIKLRIGKNLQETLKLWNISYDELLLRVIFIYFCMLGGDIRTSRTYTVTCILMK